MEDIEKMLATYLETESEPDLIEVTGGEPITHPKIVEILKYLKKSPARHLILNTNGIKIAEEESFVTLIPVTYKLRKELITDYRLVISEFSDIVNFDSTNIKRECNFMIEPERIIPFSTYNMGIEFSQTKIEKFKVTAYKDDDANIVLI